MKKFLGSESRIVDIVVVLLFFLMVFVDSNFFSQNGFGGSFYRDANLTVWGIVAAVIWRIAAFLRSANGEDAPSQSNPLIMTYLYEIPGAIARTIIFFIAALPFVLFRYGWVFMESAVWYRCDTCSIAWDYLGSKMYVITFDALLVAFLLGFANIFRSILALILPMQYGVGRETIRQLGARQPVEYNNEKRLIEQAHRQVAGAAKREDIEIKDCDSIYVFDNPFETSFSVGRIIYVSSSLVQSPYLVSAIAVELAHITQGDGRRMLALRRLVIPLAYWLGIDRQPAPQRSVISAPIQRIEQGDEAALYYKLKTARTRLNMAFFLGGLGFLLQPLEWSDYWTRQARAADRIACNLGFDKELVEMLEKYQSLQTAQPYLTFGNDYIVQRIDAIHRHRQRDTTT